ncbi:cytochrome b [Candidimonas sp. SYP-B2681]|uniref:cytochrome b n=1 Tax=Candidimonas sp. SYP-B2681 TaxID=2497686 RepID=UPI000F86DF2F|nr:cytochrome b [Candidimonas sp. SYP-B2681]RTZ42414.1 cytochrome b [Candidimonas sp. SYP-B2681]
MVDQRYTRTAIFLHWLIAALLIGQFSFGWYLDEIPRGVPERSYFVNLHKSTGIVIGLLIFIRLFWRLAHTPPPLPLTVPSWERRLATAGHRLLYALMVIMPVSGYIASNFSKYGIKFFNVVSFPPWGIDDKAIYAFFNGTHKLASWLLLVMVILHVLAALKHLFIDRDQVFSRMLLRRRAAQRQ